MKANRLILLGALAASTLPLLVQAADDDRAAKRQAREAARSSAGTARPDVATAAGALATAVVGAAQSASSETLAISGDAGKKGRRERVCYDFSKQTAGTTWGVDQEIETNFGKVVVRDFVIDGKKYTPQTDVATQYLKVNTSQIAQGASPELHGSLVNVQIVPRKPVRGISMKFAQQLGGTGQLPANLEVNGDRHDFRGALDAANGREMGNDSQGKAKLRVVLVPDSAPEHPNSNWTRGTVEVRAVSGAIESLSFGAQAFNFDDVCIHR